MRKGIKEKKPPKIVFSEELDGAINGFAIGFSFTGIGVFLLLKPDYFAIPIISFVVGALIGVFGVLGTGVELAKHSRVKGLNNLIAGIVLLGVWLIGYTCFDSVWLNIFIFLILIIGCYAICLGLIQGIVSIVKNAQESPKAANQSKFKTVGNFLTPVVLFLTQLCGLVLSIINILKALPQ